MALCRRVDSEERKDKVNLNDKLGGASGQTDVTRMSPEKAGAGEHRGRAARCHLAEERSWKGLGQSPGLLPLTFLFFTGPSLAQVLQ
jgi:hypothetical protein